MLSGQLPVAGLFNCEIAAHCLTPWPLVRIPEKFNFQQIYGFLYLTLNLIIQSFIKIFLWQNIINSLDHCVVGSKVYNESCLKFLKKKLTWRDICSRLHKTLVFSHYIYHFLFEIQKICTNPFVCLRKSLHN